MLFKVDWSSDLKSFTGCHYYLFAGENSKNPFLTLGNILEINWFINETNILNVLLKMDSNFLKKYRRVTDKVE